MNDPKLKLAMARLLLKVLAIQDEVILWLPQEGDEPCDLDGGYLLRPVLETEWLYVMHLVEQKLQPIEASEYVCELRDKTTCDLHMLSAAFNQRATAMCKVKGIEI